MSVTKLRPGVDVQISFNGAFADLSPERIASSIDVNPHEFIRDMVMANDGARRGGDRRYYMERAIVLGMGDELTVGGYRLSMLKQAVDEAGAPWLIQDAADLIDLGLLRVQDCWMSLRPGLKMLMHQRWRFACPLAEVVRRLDIVHRIDAKAAGAR